MTRTEDVVRVRSIDTNYLNARIEALEKEVQKLKQKLQENEQREIKRVVQ